MKFKKKKGIRYEIILNMTFLFLIAIFLSSLVIFKLLERPLFDQEVKNGQILSTTIKEQVEFLVSKSKIPQKPNFEITQVISRFLRVHNIKQIVVYNSDGYEIAQIGEKESNLKPGNKSEAIKATLKERVTQQEVIVAEKSIFHKVYQLTITMPLIVEFRLWGAITVSMNIYGHRGIFPAAYPYFLAYMFVSVVILAVFSSFLMSKIIVLPLRELVEGTRKVSQGNLGTKVMINSDNELGELANSFNDMNKKLQLAQFEVVRNEKLATVGRIVAGVAHEIGNPIGAIMGYCDILKKGVGLEQAKDFYHRIAKEAERIDRIIRDLLEISRPIRESNEPFDVNRLVSETVQLVSGQEIFQEIHIDFEPSPSDPKIKGESHFLQQALVNLMTNACHFMTKDRTLTIRVNTGIFNEYKDIPIHAGHSIEHFDPDSQVVVLSVQDVGTGVDPKIHEQIFEPFFTTKEPGDGAGLGLFLVVRMLESLKATIGVENNSQGGSTFSMIFPREI